MKKYVVTVSALFIGGVKYRRGDLVELANGEMYGTNVDLVHEPVVEKPKATRKPRAKKADA